ncbi:serine/threonine protein phosphatase PrpC [Rhizobium sp. BK619]|uniref:protein phosphatase 2C domain-containing protein n=1 Tax=Rhizobium sp. BK619 TaxID=2586989 RepID=UPI00180DDBFF|nr:protein phosphatase 2C domain-containing protein [Rhizobium sp. BK619]MBB3650125.1 serine/threonine protein phosphatase PrpC [Rhizobium sp. BK619]
MKIEARWLSQKGTRTDDNRDHAGIAGRHGEFFAIVADGATNGSNNGGYARAIVEAVVDRFAGTDDAWGHELMQAKLREIHQALRTSFPTGSASIILFHVTDKGSSTVLYSGDCLLGRQDGQVHWQFKPHTLANALADLPLDAIARSTTRHLLTQSFRSREFMAPEVLAEQTASGTLLLATDGFWAELTESEHEPSLAAASQLLQREMIAACYNYCFPPRSRPKSCWKMVDRPIFTCGLRRPRNNPGAISHGRRDNLWARRCRVFQTSSLAPSDLR